MTVFVVKNSEEWQLKNLWIFPKQTGPQPIDLLVFLLACFIPKEKQLGKKKTFISAHNDISPLREPKNKYDTSYTHINTTNKVLLRYFLEI